MNHKHLMMELGKLEFQGERLTVQLELELTLSTLTVIRSLFQALAHSTSLPSTHSVYCNKTLPEDAHRC